MTLRPVILTLLLFLPAIIGSRGTPFASCCARNEFHDSQYDSLRERMVKEQIVERGIQNPEVLRAMRAVRRHLFVPEGEASRAYEDYPLPIGYDQTISQPYIVALMTDLLQPHKGQHVLEVGTGSGYQAAVLAEIVDTVFTIEILGPLAAESRERLRVLKYGNVVVRHGDGYAGWPEHAPYDAIIVTAAAEELPQPLIEQLKEGGRMIIPKGDAAGVQELTLVEKNDGQIIMHAVAPVKFVPLTRDH